MNIENCLQIVTIWLKYLPESGVEKNGVFVIYTTCQKAKEKHMVLRPVYFFFYIS